MTEKRNIFLVGPMGAGKSTIGRHLAEQLHLEFFDSDQEIEKRTGADIAWVFDIEGEEGFRVETRHRRLVSIPRHCTCDWRWFNYKQRSSQ